MIDKCEMEEHENEKHKLIECRFCSENIENQALQNHIKICTKKPKICPYCDCPIKYEEYDNHIYFCGARTRKCSICRKRILLRELDLHEELCKIQCQDHDKLKKPLKFEEEVDQEGKDISKTTKTSNNDKRVKSSISNYRKRIHASNELTTTNIDVFKPNKDMDKLKNINQEMNLEAKSKFTNALANYDINKNVNDKILSNIRPNIFAKYIPSDHTLGINDNNINIIKTKPSNIIINSENIDENNQKNLVNLDKDVNKDHIEFNNKKNVVYRSRKMNSNICAQQNTSQPSNSINNNSTQNKESYGKPIKSNSIFERNTSKNVINVKINSINSGNDDNNQKSNVIEVSKTEKLKDISNDIKNRHNINPTNYSELSKNQKNILINKIISKQLKNLDYMEDYLNSAIYSKQQESNKITRSKSNYQMKSSPKKSDKIRKPKLNLQNGNFESSMNEYVHRLLI